MQFPLKRLSLFGLLFSIFVLMVAHRHARIESFNSAEGFPSVQTALESHTAGLTKKLAAHDFDAGEARQSRRGGRASACSAETIRLLFG